MTPKDWWKQIKPQITVEFQISKIPSGSFSIVSDNSGVDELNNIEYVQFTDVKKSISEIFNDENSEFVQEMRRQLESAPAYPEQLSFTDDDWAELDAPESPVKVPGRPKRNPSPPPEHFRIEIWRESRNDQKHVRFTRVKWKIS